MLRAIRARKYPCGDAKQELHMLIDVDAFVKGMEMGHIDASRLHALMNRLAATVKSSSAELVLVKKRQLESCVHLEQRLKSSAVAGTCHARPVLAVCINRSLLQNVAKNSISKDHAAVLMLPSLREAPPMQMTLGLDDLDEQIATIRRAIQKICLNPEAQTCIICSTKQPIRAMTCVRCLSRFCYHCTAKTLQHSPSLGVLACPLCRQEVCIKTLVSEFMFQGKVAWHPGPYAALHSILNDCKPRKLIVLQPRASAGGVYETVVHLTAERTIAIPTAAVDTVNRLVYGPHCLILVGESNMFTRGYFVEPHVHAFLVGRGEKAHDVSHISDLLHLLRMAMSASAASDAL